MNPAGTLTDGIHSWDAITVLVGNSRQLLDRDTIQAQHTAIFEAIRDQDAERACARLLDHVTHLDEVRTQALADRRAREVPISSLLPQDRDADTQ